jgi:hypothetical protein
LISFSLAALDGRVFHHVLLLTTCSVFDCWGASVSMSPFSLLGPFPLGTLEVQGKAWVKFYDLSPQAMLLCTFCKSLNSHESSTLSEHWVCGFTSACGWLLSGGENFCPSWLNSQLSTGCF